ncbi:hypothetical protein BDW22DRAFT_425334 [Trametopsis cervina]|nr:hypothetical protein BDW22DRAFT_425334 [Trametopsis cervina]
MRASVAFGVCISGSCTLLPCSLATLQALQTCPSRPQSKGTPAESQVLSPNALSLVQNTREGHTQLTDVEKTPVTDHYVLRWLALSRAQVHPQHSHQPRADPRQRLRGFPSLSCVLLSAYFKVGRAAKDTPYRTRFIFLRYAAVRPYQAPAAIIVACLCAPSPCHLCPTHRGYNSTIDLFCLSCGC